MRVNRLYAKIYTVGIGLLIASTSISTAYASGNIVGIPDPTPESGSYGLVATKSQPAPTTGATISIPSNGASYTASPITVSGICPNSLLVEVFDDNVLVGAEDCTGGSFSMKVSLFNGTNTLVAMDYDDLDQAGPASNQVNVNFSSPSATGFVSQLTLTSSYGRMGVDPGSVLTWPIQISGGTGPYALSINWGDGTPAQLKSQAFSGTFDISHTYNNSGIYNVTVEATDSQGVSGFIQLVAIANGNIATGETTANTKTTSNNTASSAPKVLILPTAVSLILILPSFLLGRMSQKAAAGIHRNNTAKAKAKKKK